MLDIEELKRLYLEEGMSYAEIGRRFGYTKQHIGKLLKGSGIETRDRRGVLRPAIEDDTLRKLYVEEALQIKEVAERIGVDSRTVSKYLGLYGIPKRTDKFKECYAEIAKLEIGQSVETPRRGVKYYTLFYDMAKKTGINVSVKRVSNDLLRITRVK